MSKITQFFNDYSGFSGETECQRASHLENWNHPQSTTLLFSNSPFITTYAKI